MINKKHITQKICEQAFGLNKYIEIMQQLHHTDVSKNKKFQTLFNGYYGVRRNEKWRKHFYHIFQDSKTMQNDKLTFQFILEQLYNDVGQVEASFASKILASVKSEMPLWDRRVLNFLNLKLKGKNTEEKRSNAIHLYDTIIEKYQTDELKNFVNLFNELFPSYTDIISDIKKIDCFTWLLG